MICSMTQDGRQFFNHCQTLNTVSFLEHMDRVYREVGKMVLILDRASWHTSKNAEKFFAERDIIVLWYPIGHPYLIPVEEVWSVLKRAMIIPYAMQTRTRIWQQCMNLSGYTSSIIILRNSVSISLFEATFGRFGHNPRYQYMYVKTD